MGKDRCQFWFLLFAGGKTTSLKQHVGWPIYVRKSFLHCETYRFVHAHHPLPCNVSCSYYSFVQCIMFFCACSSCLPCNVSISVLLVCTYMQNLSPGILLSFMHAHHAPFQCIHVRIVCIYMHNPSPASSCSFVHAQHACLAVCPCLYCVHINA